MIPACGHKCPSDISFDFWAIYFLTDLISGSSSRTESLPKSEKYRLYRELRSCLDLTGPRDYSSPEEMVFCSDNIFLRIKHVILFFFLIVL
jgi:hypothetical protein